MHFLCKSLFLLVLQAYAFGVVEGGTFKVGAFSYPQSLIYYLANEDFVQSGIDDYVFDTLLGRNLDTYEIIPRIAKKWTISNDKKTFTFYLDSRAKFADSHPVTAEDIKFTWDTVFNPKNKTIFAQSLFNSFESCTVKDPLTVVFKAKDVAFINLGKLADFFYVLPKHFFEKGDFNRDFQTKLLGSGPYRLQEAVLGEKITLKRNPDYWGMVLPQNKDRYNFDTILYKVVEDPTVLYEVFKRGDIDYFYFQMSKMWATETNGPLYEKNLVTKFRIDTAYPNGFSGIVWNMRKPLFQDVRVRRALSHLLNRKKLISDLFYNNYVECPGISAVGSEYHSPKNTPIPYDPVMAEKLLNKAGWGQIGSDGIRVKDGKPFEFEVILNQASLQKGFTVYQEDLKKMGIKMNLRIMEWATSLKLREENQFDGFIITWTREVEPFGFARMWGSEEADKKGSDNFSGFKDPEVDKLSQEIDKTFDKKKRVKLIQRIDQIIADAAPMTFAWDLTYLRAAHWNKFSFPTKKYKKYSGFHNATDYWWYDADKDKKIQEALGK